MPDNLKESIEKLAVRTKSIIGRISSEEATKNAIIMPFIQTLGYDVFNPDEVFPEYVADIGIKHGEKVDYAIMCNGKPVILVECKACNSELSVENEGQLFRYFHVSDAEFALLTNGIDYRFYTDLDAPNKMDKKPFLEFSLLNPDKINYQALSKLSKLNFDADSIKKAADHLKRVTAIRAVIKSELENPSIDFVKLVFRKISPAGAMFSDKARTQTAPLVKSVLADAINDLVKANLSNAMDNADATSEQISAETAEPNSDGSGIVTTREELDAFSIVKAILHGTIPVELVEFKDWKSYASINFKGSCYKPICRLYFNNPQNLRIGCFDGKHEERVPIRKLDDIFDLSGRIKYAALKYGFRWETGDF